MPAPIRLILSEEEDSMLSELRVAQTVPQRTRDRAHMIRLNAQGWNVPGSSGFCGLLDSGSLPIHGRSN